MTYTLLPMFNCFDMMKNTLNQAKETGNAFKKINYASCKKNNKTKSLLWTACCSTVLIFNKYIS